MTEIVHHRSLFPLGACLAIVLPWMAGCGERTAGGSSTETEDLAARIVHPDGSPADGDSVFLRPADFLSDSAGTDLRGARIRDTVCGRDGALLWRDVPRGAYRLEVRSRAGVLATTFDLDGPADLGVLPTAPGASLSGTVPLPPGLPRAWVRAAGSSRGGWTDSSGAFRFEAMPAGTWRIDAVGGGKDVGQGEVDLESGGRGRVVLVAPDIWREYARGDGLLLDDFESTADKPALGDLPSGLRWYFRSDSAGGGGTRVAPFLPAVGLGTAVEPGAGWAGSRGAHLVVALDESGSAPYAQLGLSSRLADTYLDLTGFDSLVLWAKGAGTVRIDFPTRDLLQRFPDCGDHWGRDVALSPTWTRIVVREADLSLPPGACATGSSWPAVVGEVSEVRLHFGEDAEIWLDEIRLFGVGPNRF